MTTNKQDELERQISDLIEYWDFSPHQDEDARWEMNRKKLTELINQQVLKALAEVKSKVNSSVEYKYDKNGKLCAEIRTDGVPLSAIEEIEKGYK